MQRIQEALLRITDHSHAEVLRENPHDLIAFVEARQPVIDEHADELVADGLVQQRGNHRRIDPA
jgi:sirohydrochlorin ferrochelatase